MWAAEPKPAVTNSGTSALMSASRHSLRRFCPTTKPFKARNFSFDVGEQSEAYRSRDLRRHRRGHEFGPEIFGKWDLDSHAAWPETVAVVQPSLLAVVLSNVVGNRPESGQFPFI
ncbi:hypothetical protein HK405_012347 [Cladochytrium tenue]|nr:hypothetical protein HK405_012347 [Cladochytrium tenue]